MQDNNENWHIDNDYQNNLDNDSNKSVKADDSEINNADETQSSDVNESNEEIADSEEVAEPKENAESEENSVDLGDAVVEDKTNDPIEVKASDKGEKKKKNIGAIVTIIAICVLVVAGFTVGIWYGTKNGKNKTVADSNSSNPFADININDYIKLGKYKDFEVNVDITAQIKSDIAYICDEQGTDSDNLDKAVETNDWVNIDYKGTLNGEADDNLAATGADIQIGSNSMVEGFESQIIGHVTGDTFKILVTFPDNYSSPDYSGKEVEFEITVNKVYTKTPAEYTDDLIASNYSQFGSTTKEFEENLHERYYANTVQDAIYDYIESECSKFDIPQDVKQKQVDSITSNFTSTATSYGTTADTLFYYYYGMTIDEYATKQTRQGLILNAIIAKEKITMPDDYYEQQVRQYAINVSNGSDTDTEDQIQGYISDFKSNYGEDYIRYTLSLSYAYEYILKTVNVKEA